MDELTTIAVRKTTKKELNDICKKTETFDDLIKKLLEIYKKHIQQKTIDELHFKRDNWNSEIGEK
tara:strand:+ start:141 stop:335 length:195 start_codon:yes stop_codon:yes gene_type:complete